MMLLPDSSAQALVDEQAAYRPVVHARIVRGSETEGLDVVFGQVSQDVRTLFRWTGTIVANTDRVPTSPHDILTAFGSYVELELGVLDLAGNESTVPHGRLAVDTSTTELVGDGARVTLGLVDPASRVAQNRFTSGLRVGGGLDLAQVAARIVSSRDASLNVDPDNVGETLGAPYTFGLSSARDPWRELQQVLGAREFRAWFDRTGNIVVDQTPEGFGPPRTVPGRQAAVDYYGRPFNVVSARSSARDVQASGLWEDTDPTSATYVDGPYGRVTRFYESPFLLNDGQAQSAAAKIGRSRQAAGAAWRVARAFDPTWDPDDSAAIPTTTDQGDVLVAVDETVVAFGGATVLHCRTQPSSETSDS